MTFWKSIDEKAATAVITAQNQFTSAITVQGYQHVNVGIYVGSIISDMLSLNASAGAGVAISAPTLTASASVVLQRQMREEMGTTIWHDVSEWAILVASGEDASTENITVSPEPETCNYRIGVKTGGFDSGALIVRVGTS